MALINCEKCNQMISDKATECPHCHHSIREIRKNNKSLISIIALMGVVLIVCIFIATQSKQPKTDYLTSSYNYNSYNNKSSNLFQNLKISDFKWTNGKNFGQMTCKVTNNNSTSVHGYFNVDFYDKNNSIVYSQLIYVDEVEPNMSVKCETITDKNLVYSRVDFSNSSITD